MKMSDYFIKRKCVCRLGMHAIENIKINKNLRKCVDKTLACRDFTIFFVVIDECMHASETELQLTSDYKNSLNNS